MTIKRKIIKLLIRNERLCEKLNRSQKFYYFGLLFSTLAAFWWITPFNDIFFAVLLAAGALLTCAVVSDILAIYKKVWGTNIGKGFILILYAAATNLAYALSSQFVNEVVRFESGQLTYTINFVAVMLMPMFILASTFIVFFIIFMFGQFYILIAVHADQMKSSRCLKDLIPANIEEYPLRTFFLRFLVFPGILGFYWGLAGNALPSYLGFMESTTKSFIYYLEAQSYSRCALKDGERAISINEKELVVIEKYQGSYSFEPKLCVPKLKPNKQLNKDAAKSAER